MTRHSETERNTELLKKYRIFIKNLVDLTAGGPPSEQLITAIETDTLNTEALGFLLAGFKFQSYSEEPNNVEV